MVEKSREFNLVLNLLQAVLLAGIFWVLTDMKDRIVRLENTVFQISAYQRAK